MTAPTAVGALMFVSLPAGWSDRHPAPARQFVLMLAGLVEVTAGQETRRFVPGDVLLAEDTGPGGHTTTAVEDVVFGIVRL